MASESLSEWAWYAGSACPDRPWILHPCDVWVQNPHYPGDPGPHPEHGGPEEGE
jgi:hypothetical protein